MEVVITIYMFDEENGWFPRDVTFHRVGQQWQSNAGDSRLILKKVKP